MLVIGINYSPEPTGIAPYTTGMAEQLAAPARSVTVLTGVPHYPDWRVPRADRAAARIAAAQRPGRPPCTAWATTCPRGRRRSDARRLRGHLPGERRGQRLSEPGPTSSSRPRPASAAPSPPPAIARRHDVPLVAVVQDLMAKAAGQSGISGGGSISAPPPASSATR